jgi:proteasome beta subunit|tara:strand:+ start:7125 stop:7769 length:645 start_codon:yes stop_codon:yes gene_type:complete
VRVLDKKDLEKYLKGTTTVGFICQGGVVMASDSRATMGFMIADKEAQKIYAIDDKIAITTAGMVADNQMLVRLMKAQISLYKMEGRPITVKAATTLLSNVLHQNRYYPLMIQNIIGGFDDKGRIFELDMVGGMSEKKMSSTGSGSPTAYGVLETEWNENMTMEEGVKLGVKCIHTALERDAATGNNVRVMKITTSGIENVPAATIEQIRADFKK